MLNSNYAEVYNSFVEHPLAPTYFKYIEFLELENAAALQNSPCLSSGI